MSKRAKNRGNNGGGKPPEPEVIAAPRVSGAGHRATLLERISGFLNPGSRQHGEDRVLNEVHDRSEDRFRERPQADRAGLRRDPGMEEKKTTDVSDLFVEIHKLRSRHDHLERNLSQLQGRVDQLESFREEFYYGRPEPRRAAPEPPGPLAIESPPVVSKPKWASSQPQPVSSDLGLDALERAVTEALRISDLGRLGSDELGRHVQSQLGGAQISPQLLGRQRQDGWQMLFLSSPQSQDGVLLVSPGELMDAEVAQYFEGEYGRRIRGCRLPALVRREGNGFVVLRKGQVDIS
jgi:hypothetical protein